MHKFDIFLNSNCPLLYSMIDAFIIETSQIMAVVPIINNQKIFEIIPQLYPDGLRKGSNKFNFIGL